jgi:hypothetical protein
MVGGQLDQLNTPAEEEAVQADEKHVRSLARKCFKRRIDLQACAGAQDLDSRSDGVRRIFDVSHCRSVDYC